MDTWLKFISLLFFFRRYENKSKRGLLLALKKGFIGNLIKKGHNFFRIIYFFFASANKWINYMLVEIQEISQFSKRRIWLAYNSPVSTAISAGWSFLQNTWLFSKIDSYLSFYALKPSKNVLIYNAMWIKTLIIYYLQGKPLRLLDLASLFTDVASVAFNSSNLCKYEMAARRLIWTSKSFS